MYQSSTTKAILRFLEKAIANGILPWSSGLIHFATDYHGFNRVMSRTFLRLLSVDVKHKVVGILKTYKKWEAIGVQVQKGETGCPIIFPVKWNVSQHRTWKEEDNGSEDKWSIVYKHYTVFDASQTDADIEKLPFVKKNPSIPEIERFIEKFFEETSLGRETMVGTAFYSPSRHVVSVAKKEFYTSSEEYYSTIFHEMVHSTGKKMGRKGDTNFGSHDYSEEEIVAEVGAMLLCSHFGIQNVTRGNSAAYIQSWGKKLKENPNWLIRGANHAEKAVVFMLKTCGLDASEFEYQSADTKDSKKASA